MANTQGRLIENLAIVIAATQGNKNPSALKFVNPYGMLLYRRLAKSTIDERAARIAVKLREEQRLPSWVMAALDWEMIGAAAE